jgi:hypothetical protein
VDASVTVNNGKSKSGTLVGSNAGKVTHCRSDGTKIQSNGDVGGLVGRNKGTVEYSSSSVDVQGTGGQSCRVNGNLVNCATGGLIGSSYYGSSVVNCHASGNVKGGEKWTGGLLGIIDVYVSVTNCSSSGDVSGNIMVGGLVGLSRGYVSKCFSSSFVSGNNEVGGLVGNSWNVSDSYAEGHVIGYVASGGLVGSGNSVTNSYATGHVNGQGSVFISGLVGYFDLSSVVSSYYDTQTTGQSGTGRGIPESTQKMQSKSTFVGWDFTNTWIINEGKDYPRLAWQT